MANPRNQLAKPTTTEVRKDPSEYKSMGLGSLSLRSSDNKLVKDNSINFTINNYNAQFFKDAAEFVLANPEERVSISAGTFYDETKLSPKQRDRFSHRIYVSAETVAKVGKSIADYIKSKV